MSFTTSPVVVRRFARYVCQNAACEAMLECPPACTHEPPHDAYDGGVRNWSTCPDLSRWEGDECPDCHGTLACVGVVEVRR